MFGRKAERIRDLEGQCARLSDRLGYANERANQWKNLHDKCSDNSSNLRSRRRRHRVDL